MKHSILQKNRFIKKTGIILVWLVIWEVTSHIVNNGILLVGPIEVINCLCHKVLEQVFWISILGSLLRIMCGFFIGSLLGVCLAILAGKISIIKEFLSPFMAFIKATPAASFIVLFLIWWHADVLSVAISTCIVLPQVYISTLQGLENVDKDMLKMADSYKLSKIDRLHYIYRPALYPYLEASIKVSAGMAWKSGVAAEVIGTPKGSIGQNLYMSKIYLDTEGVLAWTLAIIVLSVLSETVLLQAFKAYNRIDFKCVGSKRKAMGLDKLFIKNVSKSYGEKHVLTDYSDVIKAGEIKLYDWESGAGKTTLFKLINGEEAIDFGTIDKKDAEVSILFQEDRLCTQYSAIKNVEMITGDGDDASFELLKLLDEDVIRRPVSELSGGQKRRVALVRAVVSDADIYLLDEPFNGLDDNNRKKAMEYIEDKLKGKIVLIATHIMESDDNE